MLFLANDLRPLIDDVKSGQWTLSAIWQAGTTSIMVPLQLCKLRGIRPHMESHYVELDNRASKPIYARARDYL